MHYLLGYVARAEGSFDFAQEQFQRSLELEPNNAAAYANLGFFAIERGATEEAERLLRRALTLDPANYPAIYDLGRLLVRLKRYDEALTFLNRGAEMSKEDPGIHYQLFLVYSRLKRKTDADVELANFKKLETERKSRESGMAGSSTGSPLPVPESAGSEASKRP